MNMNNIGKALVLLHLSLSVVALTWAAGLYFSFVDYGWVEPRMEVDKRVASEFDKRTVVHKQAQTTVDKAMTELTRRVDDVHKARVAFAGNQLLYQGILDSLKGADKDVKVSFKKLIWKGGRLALAAKYPYSPPLLTEVLEGIDNSYLGYRNELATIRKDTIAELILDGELTEKHANITMLLNGKKVGDDVVEPGLHYLLEEEKRAQDLAKAELDYLEKIWAPTLQEAEVFVTRRLRLEKTLDLLRK